jgi:hypothetical protein
MINHFLWKSEEPYERIIMRGIGKAGRLVFGGMLPLDFCLCVCDI